MKNLFAKPFTAMSPNELMGCVKYFRMYRCSDCEIEAWMNIEIDSVERLS